LVAAVKPPISYQLVGVLWLFAVAVSTGGAGLGAAYARLFDADLWSSILVGWVTFYAASLLIAFSWYKSLFDSREEQQVKAYPADTINVHATLDRGNFYWEGIWLDGLPVDRERLIRLAEALTHDPEFTGSRFGGKGKLFSPDEFEALRTHLLRAGFVRWRNPHNHNPGSILTPAGHAVFKIIAASAGR
jgi:hypothetical protein